VSAPVSPESGSAEVAPSPTRSARDVVVNGVRLRVEEEGVGREPVVFAHALLRDRRMFDPQVAALRDRYRCIRYDHRGQGESELTRERTISLETVYADAVALIEELGIARCHWVGVSLGGLVGLRLAVRRPDLLRSAVLLETTAEREGAVNMFQARLSLAVRRLLGPRLAGRVVLDPTMRRFYGSTFRHDPRRHDDYLAERADMARKVRTVSPAVIWGTMKRASVLNDELGRIEIPILVVLGDEDVAVSRAKAERLASAIPGARFEIVGGAGHACTVEQPSAVSALIADFLDGLPR
jgi:3-oxoadipate enol-lactonase